MAKRARSGRARPGAAALPADTGRPSEPAGPGTPLEEAARVAERLSTPSPTGTRAGLPRRVPAAHLVPGAFSGGEAAATLRSAEQVRSRLDDYQEGVRRARQAAGSGGSRTDPVG
ncbi:MAG: hypothetical protein ACJ73E_09615 [Mycobacteriales bacterium]